MDSRWRRRRRVLLAATILASSTLLAPSVARAQAPDSGAFFPFVIPWDDATSGTAVDVSYLNAKPAGVNGRIVPRDGHFVEEKTGARMRFLGTNITMNSVYPIHADAEKVAAHLAKLGINIVRIHHHDIDHSPLWDKRFPDHQHFDADALDRLDYLIYQLKLNGIYVDLNLHVSRQFTPADGFPESVNEIKTQYDKRVDNYDRRMIDLQKKFAHDYLTHVNPYTSLAYTDDPCVALIEINNENSLVGSAGTQVAAQLDDLPEPFRGELVGLWSAWLQKRYKNDAGIQTAWGYGSAESGPSLVNASSKWTLESHGLQATLTPGTSDASDAAGAPPVKVDVATTDAEAWHVQAHVAGLDLKEGDAYTVTFQAKSDRPRTMTVYAGLDQDDWHHVGLDSTAHVGAEWKTYRLPFGATRVAPNHNRLTFVFGNQTGTVELRGVTLAPGVSPDLVTGGGSLARRDIDLPPGGTGVQKADWVHFLADTERDYAEEMRRYVKDDLKAHANVIGSQIEYGASAGIYRESKMDFADGHAYWEHPTFPGKPWDGTNWTIRNTPLVAALTTNGGTLLNLAEYRVAGKPFTVTEYNEPAPNDYQSETVPELASFAALQDWDGIFLFDWANYGTAAGAANDRIQGYFAIGSNPAKAAFLPAAALLFRAAELSPSSDGLTLKLPEREALTGLTMNTFWKEAGAPPIPALLASRLSVAMTSGRGADAKSAIEGKAADATASSSSPFALDERTVRFSTGAAGAAAGFFGGSEVTVGAVHLQIPAFGDNFCAITVTPLRKSSSLLLTLVGKVENLNMVWNADRTSVENHWGTGPSQAEYVPATVTVPASAGTRVWALDSTGKRGKEIPATIAGGKLTFHTDPTAQTIWYEITTP